MDSETPELLKKDVSDKFPYIFPEKRENKNKFGNVYDTKLHIAVAGTKHTVTTDLKKTFPRKRASNQ